MSDITINYKGSAIATMDASGTKTLLTEGKYCEDDISIAYVKPSGGQGDTHKWVRPSEWPDYDKVTLADNQIYMTFDMSIWPTGSTRNTAKFIFKSVGGTKTVEIGTLVNGVFTASITLTPTGNEPSINETLPTNLGNYPVVRLTTTNAIERFTPDKEAFTPLIEIYGKSSGLTNIGTTLQYRAVALHTKSYTMFGTVSPTAMYYPFYEMYGIENICIPNLSTSNLTSLENAFNTCTSLKYLTPFSIASTCTKTSKMFTNCRALSKVDMSGWNLSGITTMESMFQNSGVEKIDFKNKTLTAITNLKDFANGAKCLANVDFSGVTTGTGLTTLSNAFSGNNLDTLDLRNFNMTNVTNTDSLCYVSNETEVWLPSTTTNITSLAFKNNSNLTKLHIEATIVPTLGNANAFYNASNQPLSNLVIYVPYSADHSVLTAYQTATNWSTFANKIVEEGS